MGACLPGARVSSSLSSSARSRCDRSCSRSARSCRGSLLVLAVVSLLLGAVWIGLTRHEPVHRPPVERPPRLPMRSGVAWLLVLVFTLISSVFFGLNAWLPDAYVEHGWSEASAGA